MDSLCWLRIIPFLVGLMIGACRDGSPLPAAEATDELVKVVFRLHAPNLPSSTSVYLTGSVAELGNWHPQQVEMNACGKHRWAYCLERPAISVIEYKYTLGSWDQEGADATGRPLQNFTVHADKDVVVEDEVVFWRESKTRAVSGQVTGEVRYHRQLQAENLKPRDLVVWLPPGYEESQARYPVLYMHDGQNLVDPATSAFGVDWQIDETCTKLIAERQIRPLIVVGIYNTSDRSQEYLPGMVGTAYMDFVVQVVKPLVDREYRTQPGREHTFVGGSSAGGLCAFMLAWQYPQVFSRALCMSPAFQMDNPDRGVRLDYVDTVRNSPLPDLPLFFYLDNGGIGLEELLQPGIDAMLTALNEKGLSQPEDYIWVQDSLARHSEAAWGARLPDALRKMLSKRSKNNLSEP